MSPHRLLFLPVLAVLQALARLLAPRRPAPPSLRPSGAPALRRSASLGLLLALTPPALFAAATLGTPSTTFTAAESGRAFMTVGGVWNGSAEVTNTTGDTFTVTFTNTGDATAFDLAPRVVLPANFTRVGTMTVSATSGTPVISATPGTTGTIDVNLGGYDLPAGASLTLSFGLRTSSTIVSGTYQIAYSAAFAATNGAALGAYSAPAQQNILVQAGDTTINITPKQQTRAVGENAAFTVTVTNTGLGGLFDVTIDEASIYPSGNNLQFVSLTKTAPALAASSANGGSRLTLPYLAPGQVFTADVVATVLSCGTIVNNVTSIHRADTNPVSDSGPVQLDLRQPLVDYTPPAVALDYNTSVPVTIPVQNTGLGSARVFRLQSNLPSLPLTLSNLGAGWSYDSVTGLFTYTANSGVIANGATVNLTFNLAAANPCTSSGAGTITYTALYENGCGDAYSIPIRTQTVSAPTNAPALSLAKTVSSSRIAVLESGSYTVTLSAANPGNIGTANITLTDVLPAQVDYVSHSTATGAASYNAATRTVTWTVPVNTLGTARTLQINFAVANDPCNAGLQPINTVNTSNVVTSRGCTLNASASVSFLISNNPGLVASQFFDLSSPPAAGAAYETGNADAAPLGTRGTGEGEFLRFEAGYAFGPAYPGTWAGSTYTDLFGGVAQMVLSSGSLTVESPSFNGGAPVAVPVASTTTLSPGFRIDLSFLAGPSFFNSANVAGRSVTFRYRATAPDSAITTGSSRAVTHLTTFDLAGAGGSTSGACNTPTRSTFVQGAFYSLARAQADVALSLPSILEVCKDETLTLTVSNANALQARNVRVTLLNSGTPYTYDTSVAPVYGGAFSAGTITHAANAGVNPAFTFTGGALSANGTIQLRVRRAANGNTTATALTARVDFDSSDSAADGANRVYNTTGSYTPSAVRKANLAVTVTPGSLTVTGATITYVTFVTNTDAGAAYGSLLTNTLPVGITVNTNATNAANPSYPVSTSAGPGGRQTLTWALGNIASGATIPITLVADVGVIPGCAIALDSAIDRIQASWGCDSNVFATVTRASPAYVFPSGKMQVVHDSTQTVARLCSPGKIVIVVKNTGPTNILGVTVREVLNETLSFFSISGSVQYRLNGGALQTALAAPSGAGTTASPFAWTSAQIPALAQLVPVGVSGTNQVDIEFNLAATEALAGNNPVLSASASATISCGSAVSSPAQPFTIPIERPVVSVAKTGRNITANPSAAFAETVYGGRDDMVEWRLVVSNTGNATADNLRLSDALTGSGSGNTAVINGPGLAANTALVSGQVLSLPSLAAGASATYTITEVLGSTCVTGARNANISWGCVSNGAAVASNVTAPGTPADPATIVMLPDITAGTQLTQTITPLAGGRARVVVNITNNGGTAYNPVVTATIPAGSTFDATSTPVFGGVVADITGLSTNSADPAFPVFTFTGPGAPHLLRFGETLSITYYIRPTAFDTAQASTFPALATSEPEPSLDPARPASANLSARVDYTTSCGAAQNSTNTVTYDPLTPDLDVVTIPGSAILTTSTAATNYDFVIRNSGDQSSVANFIRILVRVGKGWSFSGNPAITSPPGTAISGLSAPVVDASNPDYTDFTYTLPDTFTLARPASGNSPDIRVRLPSATVLDNGTSLAFRVEPRGEARGEDGVTTFGNHSLDRAAARFLGVNVSKNIQSTSEAESAQTLPTTADVLVGEEVTYRLRAKFFGAEGGSSVTGITVRDTHADFDNNPHTSLGYVGHALTAANLITPATTPSAPVSVTRPATVAAARVSFSLPDLSGATIAAGNALFETDFTVRVLNLDPAEATGRVMRNNLSLAFTYQGVFFRSNNTNDDGFTGGTTDTDLQASRDVTLRVPPPTVVKTVRNLGQTGAPPVMPAFAASASGQAGDIIEYRVVITNPSGIPAPIYTLSLEDSVNAKLVLSTTTGHFGVDTNADNVVDVNAATGAISGNKITFNATTAVFGAAGANFTRLAPGSSITLLYRGTLSAAVTPTEALGTAATLTAYSVPVDGSLQPLNQTAPKGTANADNTTGTAISAARVFSPSGTATLTGDSINQVKAITATAEPSSTGNNVLVGEQIRYRLTVELPQGTIPDLVVRDSLPAGLALVATPTVTIGSAITSTAQPTITPSVPANGNPLQIQWAFGGRSVASDSLANRTILIEYIAQVRNVAANVADFELVNGASFSFNGTGGTFTTIPTVKATVQTPSITVTRGVRNATRTPADPFAASIAATDPGAPDAGDILEYQLSIVNASGTNISSAFDLALQDTLPAGLAYIPGSTVVDTSTNLTGTLGEPDVANAPILRWGRTHSTPANLDLAPGGTLTFRYRARVADSGKPLQAYANATVVDWTSLDGAPGADLGVPLATPGDVLGERNGSGTAPNTYLATGNTPVAARNSTTVAKAKSGDTLPRTAADALGVSPSGFRVGDLATYTVTIPVQEGTLDNFQIRDTLPAGLAFHDTVSITPAPHGGTPSETQPMSYVTPAAGSTAPALGATGNLVWTFGTLVNSGAADQPAANNTNNNSLVLVYRARVLDPSGIAVTPADQTLSNTATARYGLADTSTHTTAASVAPVVARQPILGIAKAVLSPAPETINGSSVLLRRPGDTASFRITITNTGTAPAYNVRLTDTLPAGLRATAPVLTAATRNGVDVLATQTAPTWDSVTGAWRFDLADGEPLLPGQTLVLTYTTTVDNDTALRGQTLTNSAAINQFFSLPSAHPEAASRRQYAAVGPATQSLVIGLRIDGSVYHDVQPNNAKDVGEDWSGATKPAAVFANLVAANNTVVRTVNIAPGTGAFAFDYLPPGAYTIVVTNTAAATTAQRPLNWLFQSPTTGSLAAVVNSTTGDLANRDLGLNQGIYAAPAIAKAKSGDTLPRTSADAPGSSPSGFRVGDLVTYTVTVNPQEGSLTTFAVTDVLPAGLAFDNTTPFTVSPASGGRYTYTAPVAGSTAPATGASGTVTFTFGAFTNALSGPANNSDPAAVAAANTLTITYRARVRDNATGTSPAITPIAVPAVAPASTTTSGLTNSAALAYTKPAPDAGAKTAGPATATIQVEQPRLAIAKTRTSPTPSALVVPGGTANFQVVVTNDGTAPAYNTVITDVFPAGMRGTAPSAFSATLNGAAVTLVPTWTAGTGAYVVTLADTQPILPGQTLAFAYTAAVDSAATRGATLTNTATITSYASRRSADATQRRVYAPGLSATADVVVGIALSGFVYHDLQPNNALDAGEDWTGSGEPTVFVNLIQGGAVVATRTVAPGTGAFSFANLAAGSYDLIVTDSAASVVATRPVNWPFQNPSAGSRALVLSNADLSAQNFGLHQGTLAAAQIAKTKSGDTLPIGAPASGFRVGDLVTYTVDLQPREGSFTAFVVSDTLPAGLAFHDTVSIAQVSGPARFTYTTPSGASAPSAGATGSIAWNFGAFANAAFGPADNTLRLVYRARVLSTGGVGVPAASPASATVSRVNSASLAYNDGAPVTVGPATSTINIAQPRLALAKTRVLPAASNLVQPGATATFRLTATNDGTAPAYNLALADTLPVGLRDTTPVVVAATLNGADILAALPAPAYDSGTGAFTLALADTQPLLPGQTFVLDYTVTVDLTATRGSTLTNSATISAHASKPSADAAERRVYAPVGPSTQTLNIAARVTGFVYHELSANAAKDPTEDWTSGTPVFVNLVPNAAITLPGFSAPADVVLRSASVAAGPGSYAFEDVPAGDYRIVLTNTATAVAASAPSGWTLDTPSTGARTPLVVSNADYADQNFGLYLPRNLSGFVYNDISPNSLKDGFEDWTTGVSVFVNLVRAGDNAVVRSTTVNPGSGAYAFANLPPAAYRVIIANSSGSNTPSVPSGWIFGNPSTGSLPVTLALADLANQNLGLFRGRTLVGRVFRDTGLSGGTANDGRRNGAEPGLGNVTVRLLTSGLSVIDTTRTDGDGRFLLRIPASTANGSTLIVEETNPAVHRSTGGHPGNSGGAYALATDRVTFTFADADVTGVEFGDVPESAFLTDGAQTILPGATAFYRHAFRPGTAGIVTFTSAITATPADLPWTQVIVRDLDADGVADPGEPVVDGQALAVAADEEIALVFKVIAPANGAFGARHQAVLTAAFAYANHTLTETLSRQDLTTLGTPTVAGLQLTKAVDKITARPGEIITYTLTYANAGAEPLATLFIDDRTPHYTVFHSASAATPPANLGATVTITAPAVGQPGAIRWTFTGTLAPAGTGTVTFQVKVQE